MHLGLKPWQKLVRILAIGAASLECNVLSENAEWTPNFAIHQYLIQYLLPSCQLFFLKNIYHRHKPTSFRLTGKVIYPVLPRAACAYDGLAGFLFKHLLMIFEKKLGIWNSSEMSFVNLGLTFWFSCPRHQLLPGPTSLRQRCFQPWPCMGACSIFFSLG